MVAVPRGPKELCSDCLTGHGPDWVDWGTLPNTRYNRLRLRLARLLGGEVTAKLDPPASDDNHTAM